MLFDMAKLGNMDKPLSPRVLSNPEHPITKHILYLYSMETFIYSDLNRASREKDMSKIQYYGAFAAALSYIIQFANQNRKTLKLKGLNTLFRGLNLTPSELDAYKPHTTVNLMGYTSTSHQEATAIEFAFADLQGTSNLPVVFKIEFRGERGLI